MFGATESLLALLYLTTKKYEKHLEYRQYMWRGSLINQWYTRNVRNRFCVVKGKTKTIKSNVAALCPMLLGMNGYIY